jgi:two-component system sensor histidine kinase UhpB
VQAIYLVDRERSRQLLAAQEARVAALEQVQHEMEEREILRRQLLRHAVISQEEERKRIARELHDETAQILTAFTLSLGLLKNSTARMHSCARPIGQLQALSQQLSDNLYRIVHALRPAQLDDLGLVPALHYLVDEGRERFGLEIALAVEGSRQRLDPLVETVVFRIAQEAVQNVGRHAQTTAAQIRLCFGAQALLLQVQDRGVGFESHQVFSPPRGWGLAGMRERAESVGGQFQVRSTPGFGTQVEISIPYRNEIADRPCDSVAKEMT